MQKELVLKELVLKELVLKELVLIELVLKVGEDMEAADLGCQWCINEGFVC